MPNGTHTVSAEQLVAVCATYDGAMLDADGWTKDHGPSSFAVGDVVVAWGRNAYRRGIVTKVGRTNLTFEFTTPGAIDEAARSTSGRTPTPTAKVAKIAEVFAQIEAEQIEARLVESTAVAEVAEVVEAPVAEVEPATVAEPVEVPAELADAVEDALAPAAPAANREAWLTAAVDKLRPIFAEVALAELPATIRVSCGFPGGKSPAKVIGQCWYTAEDGAAQVFVSPVLVDPVDVLGVLVHELVHAWDGGKSGHKGAFRRVAVILGLEGKMTATTVGDALRLQLAAIAAELGEYPHARLDLALAVAGEKKQGTRMLKVECPACGYTLRTTAKWLEVGVPTCPCGTEMEVPA